MLGSRLWTLIAAALLLTLVAILVRLAWVSDDACITLRSVENWCNGYGLTWNISERVQTYTHPLWMLLLTLARLITGEPYYGTIALGMLLSLFTALQLMQLSATTPAACVVLVLLISSRGFTDWATSGLENPLTFLLITLFATVMTRPTETAANLATGTPAQTAQRRLSLAALLTGLAMTTRMDLAVMFGPALLVAMRGLPLRASVWRVALGLSPFLAWLTFATIYYGTPFPITAYAKAFNTGIPTGDLISQGFYYVSYVIQKDTATFCVVVAGIGTGLFVPSLRCRALALGALLYCGYVIKVGGDFMGSRFFTPQFVAATAILARALATMPGRGQILTVVAAVGLNFVPGIPPWMKPPGADKPPLEAYHGILDERSHYYYQLGMLSPTLKPLEPGVTSAHLRGLGRTEPAVNPWGQVGRYGLEAGPLLHIVDPWLCDPLLMRLPIGRDKWRIGHFIRELPTGYLQTLARDENQINHPGLRRYYDTLRKTIRGPVFSGERWQALWDQWTGKHDDDLQAFVEEEYRNPPRIVMDASQLDPPLAAGTWWCDSDRTALINYGGLEIRFDSLQSGSRLKLLLNEQLIYRIRFRRGEQILGKVEIKANGLLVQGLLPYTVDIPANLQPFDSILIDSSEPSGNKVRLEMVSCIGGLVIEP